jgi:hypothetical protein
MRTRKKFLVLVTAAAAGLVAVENGAAQVCIGFPTARGQAAAAAMATFPTGGNDFGIEAGYHMPQGTAVFGGARLSTPDVGNNSTTFGAGAAFAIPEWRLALMPTGLYSCPVVSATVTTGAGLEDNIVSVPVGLGLATILPLGQTMTLSPYAVPQFRWSTVGGETATEWLVSGGAILVGFLGPRVYAGATVNRIFLEGAESVFGVKVGLVF